MSSVAAPKTFQQLRNFLCISAAFYGFNVGQIQANNNDHAWKQYQLAKWKENADRTEAAHAAHSHGSSSEIPAIVPAELHDTYKALTGGH